MASSLKNPDFENNTVTKFISSFVMNDGKNFFLDSKTTFVPLPSSNGGSMEPLANCWEYPNEYFPKCWGISH